MEDLPNSGKPKTTYFIVGFLVILVVVLVFVFKAYKAKQPVENSNTTQDSALTSSATSTPGYQQVLNQGNGLPAEFPSDFPGLPSGAQVTSNFSSQSSSNSQNIKQGQFNFVAIQQPQDLAKIYSQYFQSNNWQVKLNQTGQIQTLFATKQEADKPGQALAINVFLQAQPGNQGTKASITAQIFLQK